MVRDTGKALRGPAIVLLAVGAVFNIILFILMFRFADEENLLMVLLTAALIGIIPYPGVTTVNNKMSK